MQLLRSFKHRNFKLFALGQVFSLLGIWMQGTAVSWLVWELTHSAKWLGAIGFATQIPIFIFGLFGGALADRVRRHKLVIVIQALAMVQATSLAILTATGAINVELVFLLSLMMGVIFAFDYPSRQSFLMDMVGHQDINNAVAINSTLVHSARVVGPVMAGLIIARFGEEACFTINALSFLFVITALIIMDRKAFFPQELSKESSWKISIKEGLSYVAKEKSVRVPLLTMGVLSLIVMPYVFFLPKIIAERFFGSAFELGIAMGAGGLGAVTGATYLASKKDGKGLGRVVKWSLGVAGLSLIGVSQAENYYLFLLALYFLGLFSFLLVAGTQTILQLASPPHLRGRVMSVMTVAFFGLTPIGSIVAGNLVGFVGLSQLLMIFGMICVAMTIVRIFMSLRAPKGRGNPTN